MPDHTIAAVLNRSGKSTSCGASWTRSRVCSVRYQKEIAVYRDSERVEVTLFEAAEVLTVWIPQQVCKGAPWIINRTDLEDEDVRLEAQTHRMRRPSSANPPQKTLNL